MVFDPTPVKSKKLPNLRPRQIESNSKVSSGWYSTTAVISPTKAHSPVLLTNCARRKSDWNGLQNASRPTTKSRRNYQAHVFSHRTPNLQISTSKQTLQNMDWVQYCQKKNSANLEHYSTNLGTDPDERVISYASRPYSAGERNYSQIETKAFAIIFWVKKFEKYIIKSHFTIYTDHKRMVKLFDFQQATSATGAARIQRWFTYMSNFNYHVEYRKGRENSNGDALSHLPLSSTESTLEELSNVQLV